MIQVPICPKEKGKGAVIARLLSFSSACYSGERICQQETDRRFATCLNDVEDVVEYICGLVFDLASPHVFHFFASAMV